jgi:hypothetical protein
MTAISAAMQIVGLICIQQFNIYAGNAVSINDAASGGATSIYGRKPSLFYPTGIG